MGRKESGSGIIPHPYSLCSWEAESESDAKCLHLPCFTINPGVVALPEEIRYHLAILHSDGVALVIFEPVTVITMSNLIELSFCLIEWALPAP